MTSQTIRQHLDYLATTLTGTRFQQNAETLRSCRSELFTQVIPQASQSRQEIRHIISAIAALHRKLEFGDQPGQSGLETVFLRHQSKAIHLLGLSKDAYALEIILVACPLLAFCEFLQGNIETGISHLKSGLRILQTAQQNPFVRSPMGQLIKEYLRPLLAGIVVERAVNGSLSLHFNELLRNDSSSELIRSLTPSVPLEQVWIRLASIAQRLDRIVNGFTSPTDADSITQVRRDLDDWRDGVENFQLSTEELDTRSKKILRFSRAYKVVVDALVHAFVEGSEISFDRWSSNLCAALWQLCVFVRAQDNSALSNRAVALTGQTDITSTFWLVPPLFQCATRCRVPDVRRRALLLLRDLNRVEGPWNSSIAADIAASIIDIEERGLGEVESCSDIPNTSRVRLQIACRFPDQDGLVSLLFKPFPHKTTTPNILEECEVTDTKWISQVQWVSSNNFFLFLVKMLICGALSPSTMSYAI